MNHMYKAKIYRPARTATQSGVRKTQEWVLEFLPRTAPYHESLMGWVASADTLTTVKLRFPTVEAAKNYADNNRIEYVVLADHSNTYRPKSYSDNFTKKRMR